MKTTCEHCCFSIYEYDIDSTHQIGCKLNRLETFKEQKRANLKNSNRKYFYKIDGLCNTCRNQDWVNRQIEMYTDFLSGHDLIEFVNKEIYPKVNVIIYAVRMEGLKNTLESLNNQKVDKITIVSTKNLNYPVLKDWSKPAKIEYTKVFEYADKRKLMDYAVMHTSSSFVVFCEPNDRLDNYVDKLNDLINIKLQRFGCIKGKPITGLTIPTYIYKYLEGNRGKNIEDKIQEWACLGDKQWIIHESLI